MQPKKKPKIRITKGAVRQNERLLREHDLKNRTTRKAQKYLEDIGEYDAIYDIGSDAGRNLKYYGRMLTALKAIFPNGIKGKKILHIGASTGIFVNYLEKQGAVSVALDKNPNYLKAGKEAGLVNAVRAGAAVKPGATPRKRSFLPFGDESLDAVLSDHFIASNYGAISTSEPALVKEIARILKPGGCLILESAWMHEGEAVKEALEKSGFGKLAQARRRDFLFGNGDMHLMEKFGETGLFVFRKGKKIHRARKSKTNPATKRR